MESEDREKRKKRKTRRKAIWILIGLILIVATVGGYKTYGYIKGEIQGRQCKNNDHGLVMIDYATLKEKIASGESFVIYIGRDTCPHCQLIAPAIEEIKDSVKDVPFYYLNCYQYRQDIKKGKKGAQEEWDSIKFEMGFMYIPCVFYYKDGRVADCYLDFVGEDYFEIKDEKTKTERLDDAIKRLDQWFIDNKLINE